MGKVASFNFFSCRVFLSVISPNIIQSYYSINPKNILKSQSNIIASSQYNFQIELIQKVGVNDIQKIIEISEQLVEIFGSQSLMDEKNIHKYFNTKTLPFIARYNQAIIGYIIGVPLEYFKDEAWSHFDTNLFKKNTLYTYAFILDKKFQIRTGYAKTLKMSWQGELRL